MRWSSAVALLAFPACRGAANPRDAGPLVDPEAWELAGEGDDPFEDRPAQVDCAEDAWGPELIGPEMSLSIDTFDCDYLTVRQPSLARVIAGDGLFARLWHYELTAADDAEAHAALRIGDTVVWEERIPIPSESGMSAPQWPADADYAEGETVWFHLHNHGANSWSLIEFSATPPEDG